MEIQLSRRLFLQTSSALGIAASGVLSAPSRVLGANERLNIGVIGVGGRGAGDLAGVAHENIVALCDVDEDRLGAAAAKHPSAKKYVDYRKLLEQDDLDAVVVATPDHHHAPATVRALRRGLHVYCEKPLTHTVAEARLITKLTAEKKLATQMGTQNHEHPGYLRLVELLQSGAIGNVTEVHVITDRPGRWWPQGLDRPTDKPPIPAGFHWDLWLGPANQRDYHGAYAPFKWRGWWDFGCGAVGDMAIHLMDPTFWALELGGPVKVTSKGPRPNADSAPKWMETKFEFGKRGKLPAVDVYWYEGETTPREEIAKELPMNGSLFIGDKGRIAIAHGGNPRLLPEDQFVDFKGPDSYLPTSPGHHQQWIDACKTGSRTGSPFTYAGPFTEVVLLANVAYRVGKTIEFDPESMKVTNDLDANGYLSKTYRRGWEI
ncbi:MAG: Gfo/Idh/MocA family oxidoreductase [Planctomycetaceae bacterium]|nr:Gfo/Idh/MocA family oxidoreductase [Planctomycetales bacterium]MCB9922605.1 Gfo/Idh/MocA family oxidoreductase [Planctomycetaceae bacterium]